MKRLTKRELAEVNGKEIVLCNRKEEDCNDSCMYGRCKWNEKALKKLKEYEDAEEQGLLLRLPCKVGSMVYEIRKDLNQMKRETIERNGHYYHRNIDVYYIAQVTFEIEDFAELDKTVFLTKIEAEQALARMEKENE